MNPPTAAPWAMALVRARFVALGLVALLSAGAGWVALGLQFNFSPDQIFLSSDDTLRFYMEEQVPRFGAGDTVAFVALESEAPGGWGPALVDAHGRLEKIEGVDEVRSLRPLEVPDGTGLSYAPLFDAQGKASPDALERALRDPTLKRLILSEDGRVTALSVQLAGTWGDEAKKSAAVASIHAALDAVRAAHPEVRLQVAGIPISQTVIVTTLKRDQLTFVPITVLVMAVLLFGLFRNLRGVLLPFLATGVATLWAVAWLVLTGHHINVVNNSIITLLLVIAIADAVHIVARYQDEAARGPSGQDRLEVVARTVQHMTLPCFLTTTTTALGFASALVADVQLIRDFGVDAAVGVLGAFFATLLIVPAGLALLPLPKPDHHDHPARRLVQEGLASMTRFSLRRRWLVLGGAALVLAGGTWLATGVSSNQKLISELPDSDPTLRATRYLEEKLAGVLPFDVVFVSQTPGRVLEPDVVRAAAQISAFIEADPLTATARSYADVLSSLDLAIAADKATPPAGWTDEKLAQIALLFDLAPDEQKAGALKPFVSDDRTMLRVMGLAPDSGSELFLPFVQRLEVEVAKIHLDGVEVRISGGQVIAARALGNIVRDMAASIGLALVVIFAFIALLFRSLKMSFIALLPNVVPILMTLAAMRLLDIDLRVATVIIFCMSLGVAVDACVHLLARLREVWRDGVTLDDALVEVERGAGRPVVYATVLLLVGFAVMGLSDFNAIRDFAILAGTTLGAALVVDLLLLPPIVRVVFWRRA